MSESAAMSALSAGDVNGFLAAIDADEREIIEWSDGTATVVRVGAVTLRSTGDGAFDAHGHAGGQDEAHECFLLNVTSAQRILQANSMEELFTVVTGASAVGRVSMSDIPYSV